MSDAMESSPTFLRGSITDQLVRADAFLCRLVDWTKRRQDVRALIVVGSFARGEARPDSDLDVVLLTEDPALLLRDTTWITTLGDVLRYQLEPYGRVTAIRAYFRDGLEVELAIAHADWARMPHDSGTLRVTSGGMQVLMDHDGEALQLAASVAPDVRRLTIFDRLARWIAVRRYRKRLGRLLVLRYGRERQYSPPQVLTTIKLNGLSERFAPYACAMFCSKQAYSEFVTGQVAKAKASVDPLQESSVPLWAGVAAQDWPTHSQMVTDLGHAHGDPASDFDSGHFGDHAADLGDHNNTGGGGHHDGGSHDGGGDGTP